MGSSAPTSQMQAVIVDHSVPGALAIRRVDKPEARPNEALVRVVATSLNRWDLEQLAGVGGVNGARPGRDVSGLVERAAADGSGPVAGTRVVALVPREAWAGFVCVPAGALATLPDAVSFAQASTLPTAGLTALHVVGRGGSLVGRPVLVAGATGGVGLFALQIAHLSGAYTVALIRNALHDALVEDYGADRIIVGTDPAALGSRPFHLIVDGTGDPALARASLLRPGGVRVAYGAAGGFDLFAAVRGEPDGLERLVALVQHHRLRPHVEGETSWINIASVAQQLRDRAFVGKAVLHVRDDVPGRLAAPSGH